LEDAGYNIVPKGAHAPSIDVPTSDEDREWTEGKPKLVSHLRRARASGLAQAKKDKLKRQYGRLFCERCELDPVIAYGGLHGEACIEVHHSATHVEHMSETHITRLEDLECLCANCHRVEHRLLKQSLMSVV
jgi:predicted HNH restriction endonuclease